MSKLFYISWEFYKAILALVVLGVALLFLPYLLSLFYEDMETNILKDISLGTIGTAILGFASALWQYRFQERQKQYAQIQAALAAFEDARITLLSFKGEFIDKGQKEREQHKSWEYITSLPNNIVLKFFEEQFFYNASFAENLSFIAEKKPSYLIFFYKSYQQLKQLNFHIDIRNRELTDYRNSLKTKEKYGEKEKYIDIYGHILSNLNLIVDNALAFHGSSFDRLVDYTKKNYCVNTDILQKQGPTNYERLMPPDNYLEDWDNAWGK